MIKDVFTGISAAVWTTLLAALFALILIARGYKRGILTELSGLIALLISFFVLVAGGPYLLLFFPASVGRIPRAVIYLLLSFLVFRIAKSLISRIGRIFRKVPVLGFMTGVLGAAAGCAEAVLILLIVQTACGIDIAGAVTQTLDKLPFGI